MISKLKRYIQKRNKLIVNWKEVQKIFKYKFFEKN